MSQPSSNLHYVAETKLTWSRRKRGMGFQYLDEIGSALPAEQVERIENLRIPPAWVNVKISPSSRSHIQVIGTDAKGRKQYIYHPAWIERNQQQKFDKMVRFGEVLPTLRETVTGHMRQHSLSKERVLATVVWLLEHTFIRVGNRIYQKENDSYGLTTMREKHVEVIGNTVSFTFKGKSGVFHELSVAHPRVATTIRQLNELPGYEIFKFIDDEGERRLIDSQDVNEYLQSITGEELSAKDFRTWGGTTLAGDILYKEGSPASTLAAKRALVRAVKEVSSQLGNTMSVCRKYYIHPKIIRSYERDILVPHFAQVYKKNSSPSGLSTEELAAWTLLRES